MSSLIVPKISAKEALVTPDLSLPLTGPQPRPYDFSDDKYEVLSASAQSFLRFGLAFNLGYRVWLAPADSTKYSSGHVFGRDVRETSKVADLPRPQLPVELYEKVREAVTILDIDVMFRPCPKEGPNWRRQVLEATGKAQFPYMKDPNTGAAMFESDDIVRYLFTTYGRGSVPLSLRLGPVTDLHMMLTMTPRSGRGRLYRPARVPSKPLVLWSFEGSPFCKLVRETLVELELSHLQVTAGRGSPKRQVLFEKRGRFQAPYLEDPNTGIAMFESKAIVQYLNDTYATPQ